MHRSTLAALLLALGFHAGSGQTAVLDTFDDIRSWKPIASDAAHLVLRQEPGLRGNALVLDFAFTGAGYAIAQRKLPLVLPPDYVFTFALRGDAPDNNFEVKLLDSADNVFWLKRLNVVFPKHWTTTKVRKRQVTFAWGPSGSGTKLRKVDRMEFVVSAGTGGAGKVYIDDLRITTLDGTPESPATFTASAEPGIAGASPRALIDDDPATVWAWSPGTREASITIDRKKVRELGGLRLDWVPGCHAFRYEVLLSDDGARWSPAFASSQSNGGRDFIPLPDAEARYVRLRLLRPAGPAGFALRDVRIEGAEFTLTPNAFFSHVAASAPPGRFPRYFSGKQTFWTVVGASGDMSEALVNEFGAVEVDRASCTLEPFLYSGGKLTTWADVRPTHWLEEGCLPIPSVQWHAAPVDMTVRAFAPGEPGASTLLVTYVLHNGSDQQQAGTLFLAVRPFQVNPPWQELNTPGGVAPVHRLNYLQGVASVNDHREVIALTTPDAFGAVPFEAGDITEYLAEGRLPESSAAGDTLGYASGAFAFSYDLPPNGSRTVVVAVPFHARQSGYLAALSDRVAETFADGMLEQTRREWRQRVETFDVRLPGAAADIIATLKAQLAYILINRDGPAIQPGSRSYERAWIRDGSLTSTALLQTGRTAEVRQYIDWYEKNLFPSGKVPCVVDTRGPDPVPENDSHGQFIYAVMQYFRYTGDTAWVREKMPAVIRTVRYIQQLRRERMTEVYRSGTPLQQACYGLVPESISHEGYSEKPMHSYWDDFFVMRGLRDATSLAELLAGDSLALAFAAERDDMHECLLASLRKTMENAGIDYLPGCAELADFDATSTTVTVSPCGERAFLPQAALRRTFEKYLAFTRERRLPSSSWVNYTPYEIRTVGTFVYLHEPDHAHELLQFFLDGRIPRGWRQWAEVVWHDTTTPRFIGDMPHTWVGSDYVRAVRTMLAYERDEDTALVIGAGVLPQWADDPRGVVVRGIPTYYGPLTYTLCRADGELTISIGASTTMPPGGIVIAAYAMGHPTYAEMNGNRLRMTPEGEVVVRELPATVRISYE
jgi:hypothetical protein